MIKYNGNGTVEVKTWFALVSFLVFFAGVTINVFSFVKYDPVRVCVEENTQEIKDNRKRIETLEKSDAVNTERYEWIKNTLSKLVKERK